MKKKKLRPHDEDAKTDIVDLMGADNVVERTALLEACESTHVPTLLESLAELGITGRHIV